MRQIEQAAQAAHAESRFSTALSLYSEAARAAHTIGDPRAFGLDFQVAECLHLTGRLREALLVLGDVIAVGRELPSEDEDHLGIVFNAFTRSLEIAVQMPVSLAAIRNLEHRALGYLDSIGKRAWRHKLLLVTANLGVIRGRAHEALADAEEAWTLFSTSPVFPGYWDDCYLRGPTLAALAANDLLSAQAWIDRWVDHQPNHHPQFREHELTVAQTRLARRRGDRQAALLHARHMATLLAADDDVLGQAMCMLSGALFGDEPDLARSALGRVLTVRHSQSLLDRLAVRNAQAAYWLAQARRALAMPPADDDFEDVSIPQTTASFPALRRARIHLRWARAHGQRIDELLETSYHTHAVDAWLARCGS